MEKLEEIFYSPKQGLVSADKLIQKAKEAGIKLTENKIKKWCAKQSVNQVQRVKKTCSI